MLHGKLLSAFAARATLFSNQQQHQKLFSRHLSNILISYTTRSEHRSARLFTFNNRYTHRPFRFDNIKLIATSTTMTTVEEAVELKTDSLNDELVEEGDDKKVALDEQSNSHSKENPEASSINSLDGDEEEYLESLRIAYFAAREKSENKWLDYRKTCFVYLYRGGGQPNEALAAFDVDGTIIKPRSNKRIPKSATDWQFYSAWTKVKLQEVMRVNSARFVLFTNQNGIGLGIVPLEEVQERIELVTKRLDIPCIVFMAVEKDNFRKPDTGMFKLFKNCFNDNKLINLEKSFYCGDAVGYPSHSDADIKFAQSLGLPFLPPDKFVRGVKPKLLTA